MMLNIKYRIFKTGISNLFLCLLIFFTTTAFAQIKSLDSILKNIEQNHPELKMYDAKIKAFSTYAEGADSWEAPQLGIGPFMTPYNREMRQNMGSILFSVQQMIPNPKKIKAKQNYMQAMSSVEAATKSYTMNQLFAEAKMNYYEWVILKKKLLVLKESEGLINFIVQLSELHYTYEHEKLNNIYKAKAKMGELQNMTLMFENEIRQKNIALNMLLNQDKSNVFDVDTMYEIKNYEVNLLDTSTLQKVRSDVKTIDNSINLFRLEQMLERSKIKPDIGIKYEHLSAFGTQPNQFSLMGMITLPAFPWVSKEYKSNISAMNFEVLALQEQKKNLINTVSGKLKSITTEIQNRKKQMDIYQQTIIPSLRKSYETAALAYQQNQEDLFVVLDAWEALKMVKINYLDKLQELLKLQVEYEKEVEQK